MSVPVSLLVPCFNAAEFLPRLAEGVCRVQPGFAEMICYDDGSTDNTSEVAHALGYRVTRVERNEGVSRARNRLAQLASCPWIHFHDADDRIHPRFNEDVFSMLNGGADVATCDADWIVDPSEVLVRAWRYDRGQLRNNAAQYLLQHPMGLNSSIIRRELWLEIKGAMNASRCGRMRMFTCG